MNPVLNIKSLLKQAGFLAICWLLIGCQPQAKTEMVSFAFAGDSAELAAYQTLIDAFEQAHPEITIQLRHSPSRQDFQQKLVTMFDGGQPPDVVLLNYRRFARFADDGDLQPVAPFSSSAKRAKRR